MVSVCDLCSLLLGRRVQASPFRGSWLKAELRRSAVLPRGFGLLYALERPTPVAL